MTIAVLALAIVLVLALTIAVVTCAFMGAAERQQQEHLYGQARRRKQ